MTAADLKAWLLARGYGHAAGRNAGNVDYKRACPFLGYRPGGLAAILRGRRPVPKQLVAFIAALDAQVGRQPSKLLA
jgi:hypothetical protein